MRRYWRLSILIILATAACVDRIEFNTGEEGDYSIVVNGFISDQPGPYEVNITKSFDIQSKLTVKTPISVKSLVISDNTGTREKLSSVAQGVYRTSTNGIQGIVGRAYKLNVELLDGRVYESIPDTLTSSGTVDSVYYQQITYKNGEGITKPGFDIYFNSSLGSNDNFHYLWKFKGTYQIETNPELYDTLCVEARCPKPKPCSGYRTDGTGELLQIGPCECCTCWVNFFNDKIIISDNEFIEADQFTGIKAALVPINQWTFMHKVHAEVQQYSLSSRAFAFWKAIKDQKEALTSLFQPIAGKVPGNFFQTSGKAGPIEGLFYATSISSKAIFITPFDVYPQNLIPPQNVPYINDCRTAFPYSYIERPIFWE